MKKLALCGLMGSTLLLLAQSGLATVVNYSGTWAGSGFSGSLSPDPFSGNFAFHFDDSLVTGAPNEPFNDIPLDSLSLSPDTIGATVYDLSNTGGWLSYSNGVLFGVGIGGIDLLNNTSGGISFNSDDFLVGFAPDGAITDLYIANAGNTTGLLNPTQLAGTLVIARIPEPATLALFGLGLAGLGAVRRKKLAA